MVPPAEPVLYSFPDSDSLAHALADYITKVQREAISKRNRFTIALSGGSFPKSLHGLIGHEGIKWDRW